MWWLRRPQPPRIRFQGKVPAGGRALVRLPEDPALASLALDGVEALRHHHPGGLVVMAPAALFPQLRHHFPGMTLVDSRNLREAPPWPSGFQVFWDLGESPLPSGWLRRVYPALEGPHLALHEEGTLVVRVQGVYPVRWQRMLELMGVAWRPLEGQADLGEERVVVDFLKGNFGWKGQPLLVVEGVEPPVSSRYLALSVEHPEIQKWTVSRMRALLALARVYLGAGVYVGEAMRQGLAVVLTRRIPVHRAQLMEGRSWSEVERTLPV